MKVAVFDTHRFERPIFDEVNREFGHSITYFEPRLTAETAVLAEGHDVACIFVNDRADARALRALKEGGVRLVATRTAGFNQIDLDEASGLGIRVVRVPAYSPYAVAEHAACLILALNRKIHRAHARVREHNFSLDALVGFDLHGKTVGVAGTGRIGSVFCQIMRGFGCEVLAFDANPDRALELSLGMRYVPLDELFRRADIVSLHVPLRPETRHLIDANALQTMKRGVMLINTGRGALIDTQALIAALKSGHVGSAGLDVYEEEENLFFRDLSEEVLQDDMLASLQSFPNVLITAHQAFLTREALQNIAETTLRNIAEFAAGKALANEVRA